MPADNSSSSPPTSMPLAVPPARPTPFTSTSFKWSSAKAVTAGLGLPRQYKKRASLIATTPSVPAATWTGAGALRPQVEGSTVPLNQSCVKACPPARPAEAEGPNHLSEGPPPSSHLPQQCPSCLPGLEQHRSAAPAGAQPTASWCVELRAWPVVLPAFERGDPPQSAEVYRSIQGGDSSALTLTPSTTTWKAAVPMMTLNTMMPASRERQSCQQRNNRLCLLRSSTRALPPLSTRAPPPPPPPHTTCMPSGSMRSLPTGYWSAGMK